MSINFKEVESSSIAKIGYDQKKEELHVEFKKGNIYQYYEVPITIYEELMGASSIGKYFIQNIKDVYLFDKL